MFIFCKPIVECFLSHFWAIFVHFWATFGSFWGHYGAIFGHCWAILNHFDHFSFILDIFPASFLHFFCRFHNLFFLFCSFYSSSDCKNWLKMRRRRKWQVFKKCFVVIIGASILMNEILCAGKIPTWGWFGKVFPLSVFPLLKVWCHWPPSKIQSNYNRTEFSNQF